MSQSDAKFFIGLIFLLIVAYTSYQFGYATSREEYSTPVSYTCKDGSLYRKVYDIWMDMKQPCKTVEQMKG
jgi:hypothetical protein